MWVRKRLDLSWLDLAHGMANCILPRSRVAQARALERMWTCDDDAIACLSVRSGFDLWLSALNLPRGSEVIVSAITIPDMIRIIRDHGLLPVPVDVDHERLAIDIGALKRAVTPRTRIILLAHLFGTRQPLDAVTEFARDRELLLVEDCAQAFVGREFTGHSDADVSMFSFGPIKTATALGGGLLRVRDRGVLSTMRTLLAEQPRQSRWAYFSRAAKYAGMKLLSSRPLYTTIFSFYGLIGRDPDGLVSGAVRGFAGPDFFRRIRRQPSAPLLSLIYRRIAKFDRQRIVRRTRLGARQLDLLDGSFPCPGAGDEACSYWVFAVLAHEPAELIAALRAAGFDGSSAHSMCVVEPPDDRRSERAEMAETMLPRIVYLPHYTQLPDRELQRMASVLKVVAGSSAADRRGVVGLSSTAEAHGVLVPGSGR